MARRERRRAMTDPKLPTVTYPGGLSPTEHAIQQAQAWQVAHMAENSPTPGEAYLIIRDCSAWRWPSASGTRTSRGATTRACCKARLAQRETDARMCEARGSPSASIVRLRHAR